DAVTKIPALPRCRHSGKPVSFLGVLGPSQSRSAARMRYIRSETNGPETEAAEHRPRRMSTVPPGPPELPFAGRKPAFRGKNRHREFGHFHRVFSHKPAPNPPFRSTNPGSMRQPPAALGEPFATANIYQSQTTKNGSENRIAGQFRQ